MRPARQGLSSFVSQGCEIGPEPVRHSGAGHVEITLDSTDEGLTLTIADDGRGFDPSSADNRGLGLRSMRERVEAMGGAMMVHSAAGRGTQVIARCGKWPGAEAPPTEAGR